MIMAPISRSISEINHISNKFRGVNISDLSGILDLSFLKEQFLLTRIKVF